MGLSLYKIDKNYNKELSILDNKVADVLDGKEKRPFVGVLIIIENFKYLAPLSSPKKKHLSMKNNLDFHKIDNGKLGVINFNNMVPVKDIYMTKIEPSKMIVKDIDDQKYIELLKKQLTWLNKKDNKEKIINKAMKIRNLYLQDKLPKKHLFKMCKF